jgi:type II secretory pathway pseudopilin PulG
MGERKRTNSSIAACSEEDAGLTLIEITFAVLILAGSLVVLLGLQTSSLQRANRDKLSQQAMLKARRLIAPLESTNQALQNTTYEGTFVEVLKQIAPYDVDSRDQNSADPFTVRVEVKDWALPEIGDKVMKQVEVVLAWSDSANDRLILRYFIPADEGQIDEEGEAL